MRNNGNSQNGYSLMAIIVGLGMIGVLSGVISSWYPNILRVIKVTEEWQAKEELKNFVRVQLDCVKTVANFPRTCKIRGNNRSHSIALYSAVDSAPFISSNSTQVGNQFKLRAHCNGGNYGVITVEVATTNEWKALFKSGFEPSCLEAMR